MTQTTQLLSTGDPLNEDQKFISHLIGRYFLFFQLLCTFVFVMLVCHVVRLYSALAAHLRSLLGMGHIRITALSSGMRLSLATISSRMENTQMVHMSSSEPHVVWTSENEADRVPADLVISLLDEIVFYKDGKEQKRYNKKKFVQFNPNWAEQENID